jgi:hypothetical protein
MMLVQQKSSWIENAAGSQSLSYYDLPNSYVSIKALFGKKLIKV